LGNSPDEYTPRSVGGKTVVFTTTNGTRAMRLCGRARRVLIGAFVNLSAVCRTIENEPLVHLICAGTQGEITREDVLLAGAIAERLKSTGAATWMNDEADLAADAWRTAQLLMLDGKSLAEMLRASRGGRNLLEVGHGADIELAAMTDRFDLVPKLDVAAWRITL
jgi:2-phosphosulfolactate phosphatase